MNFQNIVITGTGIVSAIGIGKEQVAKSLLERRSGIGKMRYLDSPHHELPVGEVKLSNEEMKASLGLPADEVISRTTLMGMMAVEEAVTDAELRRCSCHRIVLISGTTVAGMDITEKVFGDAARNGITSNFLDHHDCGSCTKDIASHFGKLFTDYTTISTACSSAANAILLGADMLRNGYADIIVAGGTEALSNFHLNGFNSLMILDHDICRPFADDRAGLNLGEGAAYVVLEREYDAKRHYAHIEAWLAGYGNACDAFHQTASSPEGVGAQLAMSDALRMASMKPEDIDWIHAHGTGTPDNDKSESAAISKVFGDGKPKVSGTKNLTGHTTSASGAISAVISIIAMHQKSGEGLHNVMVNSFGFGGNDTSLILSDKANPELTRLSYPEIVEVARVENDSIEHLQDIKQYVKPMEARRMGKLMKSALLTSLQALEKSGIAMPDAIVTGTAWGSLEYSERLLLQQSEGDDTFSPTYFMQSTHNTISSTIAIHLKCHGYNITFTQGEDSLKWAMFQAKLLLHTGRCKTILVGCHDESTELFNHFLEQSGRTPLPPVHSVSIVLKLKE